jgi:hypothetical protein
MIGLQNVRELPCLRKGMRRGCSEDTDNVFEKQVTAVLALVTAQVIRETNARKVYLRVLATSSEVNFWTTRTGPIFASACHALKTRDSALIWKGSG